MITKPALDCKYPVGNGVSKPEYKSGGTDIIKTKTADMKNSGTDINITASTVNLSAKFKYPRVKQDIPEAGRNQYA
jgi:hypothetical protein